MNPDYPPEAVLFDLDGTFADTAPDLAQALNHTLNHWNRAALSLEQIRPVVSQGGIALIRLGFDMEPESDGFEERRQFLLQFYKQNLCAHTRLFDGIEQVLDVLEQRQIPWGIVTNKPSWLTDPLLLEMHLSERAGCIVSGDTCSQSKPHPEPLLHACELLSAQAAQSIYVGDDQRDVIAGQRAGMTTIAATYGYITDGQRPEDWHADGMIGDPRELVSWIDRLAH